MSCDTLFDLGSPDPEQAPSQSDRESAPVLGLGAEYLVAADLALSGHHATVMAAGCAFDVLAVIDGLPVRFQVKSCGHATQSWRNPHAYSFYLDGNKREGFNAEACDVVAPVARDIRKIVYVPASRLSGMTRWYVKPATFATATVEAITLRHAVA